MHYPSCMLRWLHSYLIHQSLHHSVPVWVRLAAVKLPGEAREKHMPCT